MSRRHRLLAITAGATLAVAIAVWGTVLASAGPPYIDLTSAGATVSSGGALFVEGGTGAGTGQFDPFLTVGSNADTEQGYNSCPEEFDTSGCSAGRTHSLSAAAIPSVTISGTKYREFSLDANDTGSDDYMSVDEFKLFIDNQSDLHQYDDTTGTFGNDDSSKASKFYQAPGVILMRSQTLTPGSGVSDITVDVPDNLFPAECYYGSQTCNKWVVLFTRMGAEGTINVGNGCSSGCNYNVTGGFEEWRTQKLPVVNVTKTAVPSLTRTFPWTLKKEVSVDGGQTWVDGSANLNLFNGNAADVKWRITYTKGTGVDSGQGLIGSVTVTNPTGTAPFTFGVSSTVNSLNDVLHQTGASDKGVTLSCPGTTFPKTLAAGASFTCTYTTTLTNSNTGTNTATATLSTNDTYSGSANFDPSTATPTLVDNTGNLTDNFDPNLPKTVSGSGTEEYTQNQACGSSRTVTNTANLQLSGSTLHDPASVVIACYGLTTTKNANPTFSRTFDWTVKKYVSLDGVNYDDTSVTLHQFLGDTGTLYWKIVPTRGAAQDGQYAVTGTITVHNDTPLNASNVSVSDSIAGPIAATVDCDPVTAGNQTTLNVASNSTGTCSYSATLPDSTTRVNTATATLFGVPYTGQATIDFAGVTPTTTDDTASLDDDLDPGLPGAATSGVDVTYTTQATCGDSRTITNTAVLTEGTSGTKRTDPAAAVIDCQSLAVAKTANPSFTRTWTWHVAKTSKDSVLTLQLGQTYFEPYSVTYTASSADTNIAVSGTITITSPANAPTRTINSVSDVYAGNNATVDCNGATAGDGLPTSISAGGTLTCTYTVAIAAKTNGNNTAKATLQNSPSGTHDFTSAPVPVTFGAPTSEVDEAVNVADTVPAGSLCIGTDNPVAGCTPGSPPSGTVTASQLPKTFTYVRIIGPYQSGDCGDHTIDNTASFITNDTAATGSSSVSILVHVPCPIGCTLTQGYWKTHSIRGPAPFDDNWNNIPTLPYAPGTWGGNHESTVFFYSGQSWYTVFWTPPKGGNAYYQLAHQYEAAVLNVLNAADPSAVTATLNSALALFNNPLNTPASIGALKANAPLRQQFVSLAGILGSYNEGTIGPGHCSEDTTSSSSP